jgi:hypothetical protein
MINDVLTLRRHKRPDAVVRFQRAVALRVRRGHDLLVDIGAGSGKFLFAMQDEFRILLGVEINDTSRRYATDVLQLPMAPTLPSSLRALSLATFWHSLEHIPADAIGPLLDRLRASSGQRSRVIVSVPSATSLQYRLFRRSSAFYDVPNHLHQFSPTSLDMLMARHGFERVSRHFAFPYALFGHVQSLLNLVNPIHNYLYFRRKRGHTFGISRPRLWLLDVYNLAALPFALAAAMVLVVVDLLVRGAEGVATVCYAPSAKR